VSLPLTAWQEGQACTLNCQRWAIENLSDDAYKAHVTSTLALYSREAERLLHGEALRALREEDEA
jgi:hypothetical protein